MRENSDLTRPLRGRGRAPGTCGQLLGNFTEAGEPFHITLPIDRYATVDVTLTETDEWVFNKSAPPRTRAAIIAASELLGAGPFNVDLICESELEPRKGFGASTAESVAATRAIAGALCRTVTPEQEAAIAAATGPVAGIMYPGVAAVEQVTGRLIEAFDWFPELAIVMVVPAGERTSHGSDLSERRNAVPDEMNGLRSIRESRGSWGCIELGWRYARSSLQWSYNPMYDVLLEAMDWAGRWHGTGGASGFSLAPNGTIGGLLHVLPPAGAERDELVDMAKQTVQKLRGELRAGWRVELVFTPVPTAPDAPTSAGG